MRALTTVFESGLPILRGVLDPDRIIDVSPLLLGSARLSVGPAGKPWYEATWQYATLANAAVAAALWDGSGRPLGWIRDHQTEERREAEEADAELFAVSSESDDRATLGRWDRRLRTPSSPERILFITNDYRIVHPSAAGLDPVDRAVMPLEAEAILPGDMQPVIAAEASARAEPLPPGFETLTPERLEELARQGAETRDELNDVAVEVVALFDLADRIRTLRVIEGRTWRGVARAIAAEVGAARKWQPLANQLMGVALCRVAAEHFGEDYYAAPWNGETAAAIEDLVHLSDHPFSMRGDADAR